MEVFNKNNIFSAKEISIFLKEEKRLRKSKIGEYLGEK